MIHPNVSDLHGLPLLVVLAVHVVVNHQLTLTNVVSHIEGINIFHVNHHQQTVQRPLWRKFLLMWCILMSATSLVISSRFYSPSTVSSTTNSLVLDVWSDILKVKKNLISTTITTAYHILVNENFNWCDTSYCQRPPWSSPPCCPCRPQCRPPPNNMSKK